VLIQNLAVYWDAEESNIEFDEEFKVEFKACEDGNGNDNDLEAYYEKLLADGMVDATKEALFRESIVTNCAKPTTDFIQGKLAEHAGYLNL
jgi:hypothetical protein